MKLTYRKLISSFILAFWSVVAVADPPVFEVSGTISDKISGKTIANAKVFLVRNGEVLLETTTNKEGSFVLKFAEDDLDKGSIKVQVRKMGYRTEIVNTAPGLNHQMSILLTRAKSVPIMVPKKSPTGQYIIVKAEQKIGQKQKAIWI